MITLDCGRALAALSAPLPAVPSEAEAGVNPASNSQEEDSDIWRRKSPSEKVCGSFLIHEC